MPNTSKRWRVRPVCPDDHLLRFPQMHRLLVQILFNRDLKDPKDIDAFLNGTVRFDDPMRLHGMPEALERIRYAIQRQQSIAVYGDFDADGVTSTALLVETLRAFGARVSPTSPTAWTRVTG